MAEYFLCVVLGDDLILRVFSGRGFGRPRDILQFGLFTNQKQKVWNSTEVFSLEKIVPRELHLIQVFFSGFFRSWKNVRKKWPPLRSLHIFEGFSVGVGF